VWTKFLTIKLHWNTRIKRNSYGLDTIWRLLRRNRHSKINKLIAICIKFFQKTCLIASVQAILIRAVRFCFRSFHRNRFFFTKFNEFFSTWKTFTKRFYPPRCKHLDRRINGLSSQLKTALIIAFTGRTMCKYGRTLCMCKIDTDLTYQGPGDRCPKKVCPLVACLPLHGWKRVISAEFLSYVNKNRFFRTTPTGFFKRRLSVFTRLSKINVDTNYFVPLLNQPAKYYGRVETTRVREDAFFHSSFPKK